MMSTNGPILLFDGVCNLCNSSVQFVIAHDPKAIVRFASLQSDVAKTKMREVDMAEGYLDSIILLVEDKMYVKSSAALRVCKYLSGLWPVLQCLLIIPRPIRDYFYDVIARNRYRWFGRQETCWVPTIDLRARFLDA
jgi:predicted DCC family thiol-disulfide oxidoreductase YuxK